MPTLNVNDLFWSFDLDLNEDGEIDEDVIHAFTRGHCHSFAIALAEHMGWKLVGINPIYVDEYEIEDAGIDTDPDYYPDHIACIDRDGNVYDVTGRLDTEYEEVCPVPDEDRLRTDGWGGLYRTPEPEVACLYLEAWKERHL